MTSRPIPELFMYSSLAKFKATTCTSPLLARAKASTRAFSVCVFTSPWMSITLTWVLMVRTFAVSFASGILPSLVSELSWPSVNVLSKVPTALISSRRWLSDCLLLRRANCIQLWLGSAIHLAGQIKIAREPDWRSGASKLRTGFLAFLQPDDQFDHVMGCLGGNPHIIHHIFHEKQPPAARRLQASQFRFEVRRLRRRDGSAATLIRDPNDQLVGSRFDADQHRQIGVEVIAVFHRVHRRLAHCRLQLFQTRLWQLQVADSLGDTLNRRALIAFLAGNRKLGQDAPAIVPVWQRVLQGDERHVVLLFPGRPGEAPQFRAQAVNQALAAGGLFDQRFKPPFPEHLTSRIVCLNQ